MISLGIDTSTFKTSVGLVEDDREIASYELSANMYNSEEVVNMISEIFSKINFSIKDIDLISVGIGPGSFTGTRIAVTIARTLSQTLNKEIVGVSSLKAVAMTYEGSEFIVPLIDAKRNRAYFGIYKNSDVIRTVKDDRLMDIDEIANELSGKAVVILGAGAEFFYDKLKDKMNLKMPRERLIRGANVARLGIIEYRERGSDNLFDVLPNYINLSQAEENFKKLKQI